MDAQNDSLQELQHIKKMMERSSRFISLSGLSGIAAGLCALVGAWFARIEIAKYILENRESFDGYRGPYIFTSSLNNLIINLITIATLTFTGAFITAFFFTYLRSKKEGVPLWGKTTIRLFWNTVIPLVAGGIFLLRSIDLGHFGLIAPGCLIFYGLALVNASKYTFGEIRYLGYGQIILGIINLWMIGYGLTFWAIGFGLLHIMYGL
ncbi:MAG: hypothetical protein ABIN25_12960, partial [Ginsengibacter sp.]